MKRLYILTYKFGKYFIIAFFFHGFKSNFSLLAAQPRAVAGAGEDREAAADAVPHAHQPGDAGVRLPRLGHAHRDPLHGGARVRRQAQDDLQVVLPAAQVQSAHTRYTLYRVFESFEDNAAQE